MSAPAFGRAIETLNQECVVIVREPSGAALWNIQSTRIGKRMKDLLPCADVVFVPHAGELGDPETSIGGDDLILADSR